MVKCSQCRYVLAVWVLWLGLSLGLGPVSQAWGQNHKSGLPTDLQALIGEALQANPEIKQMRGQYAASKETIRPAGALDDPEIAFTMKDIPTDTWAFNREPMTQKMLELSQKFPFPGKRRLRSEVAAEQANSDEYVYKDKANEVRAKVVIAYWGLSLAQTNFDLTQKNKQVWEQVVQVADTRYGVGQGMQADVLQAQVELGNYLDRLLQWTQKQESFRAELNALRAKPPQTPISRPQPLKPRPFSLKLDDLLAQAETRPQLQALKFIITKQEKAVDLARKEYFPDARVSLGYGFRETLAAARQSKTGGHVYRRRHVQRAHLGRLQDQAQDQGRAGETRCGQRRASIRLRPAGGGHQRPVCQAAAPGEANLALRPGDYPPGPASGGRGPGLISGGRPAF